ncbi:14162_t:CDS:2, partial [Cetraspora pellucida]
VGEHTHSSLPPSHIPEAIKNYINKMINNAFEYLDHITPQKIILKQAIKLYEAKYFQIYLTYKPVQGKINVFELNKYDKNHQIIGKTTNVTELAHADIKHDGKELSLMNAIEKAQRLDIQKFTTYKIQDKYEIAKTERNNRLISHASQSIKYYDK